MNGIVLRPYYFRMEHWDPPPPAPLTFYSNANMEDVAASKINMILV